MNNPLRLPSQPIDYSKLTPGDIKRHLKGLHWKRRKAFLAAKNSADIAKAMGQEVKPIIP